MDQLIGGVGIGVVVVVVVQLAKLAGLRAHDAPLAAAVAGVVLGLLAQVAVWDPGIGAWISAAIVGLVGGVGAVGGHTVVTRLAKG